MRAVWGLYAAHLLIRAVVFGSAYFLQDDFVFQGQAARRGVFTTDYLLHIHSDHLMPAGYLVAGLAEWISPLNYWVVLATLLPMQAVASFLTLRLLVSLFGARWLVLVPVTLALFSPLTLTSSTWWAAALNLLPVQACGAAAAWAGLTLLRTGRIRWGLAALLALMVGLTFDNKAALIPLVVFVVVWVATPGTDGLARSAWTTIRRFWLLWLSAVGILAGWMAIYLSLSDPAIRDVSESTEVVRTAAITLVQGFVPASLGGPLVWSSVPGSGGAYASPPLWFTVVSIHVLAALVVVGWLNTAHARRAWVGLTTYVACDLIVLALGRSGLVETIGLNLRYTADAMLLLAVAVGATFMPPRGEPEGQRATTLRRVVERRPRLTRVLALAVLYGYLAVSVVSHVSILGHLADNDGREWLANVRDSVEEVGGSVAVLDTGVPDFIYWGLGYPYNQLSWILAPIDGVKVEPVVDQLTRFDDTGRLRDAVLEGTASRPGPDGSCGWSVGPGGTRVWLAEPKFPWRYVMRVGYFTSEDTTVVARFGEGDPVEIPFVGGGLQEVFVDLEGGDRFVTFEEPEGGVTVCLDVEIGEPLIPET
jgi:hypothetical protein